jgi:hypothetical protein
VAKQPRLQVYVSSTGAEYEELPWPGLQRFRRKGGWCPNCCVSWPSHPALGCELGELI